uniref:DUF3137 domain-containing protein n=1 Tax=Anisakis simplex TaxID=6269 RepID=A0A0M3KAF6_ANISI
LIEDDAIPVPHFMPLLNSVVQQMDSNPQIDFVKLYHPRYLRKIPYYFQISLTCLAISVLLTEIIWRQIRWLPLIVTFTFLIYHIHIHYNYQIRSPTNTQIHFCNLQIFADLRYALTSSSAYLTVAESCCTPAVIYRTDSINRMLSYFVDSTSDSEPVFMIDNHTVIGRKSSEIRAPFKWLKADNNGTQLNIGGRLKHPKWPSSFAKDDQLDGSPFVSRQTDTNLVIHIGYISAIRGKLVILDVIRELERRAEHVFPF